MPPTRILVVEDEEIVALDIESTLLALDYDVADVIAFAEDAVERVTQVKPDLVLMDIRLKGKMDGIEAAEEIRQRFHLPVVYLTANADLATLQRAKITEPFGYVLKPFEERELQTTIEIALSRHQAEERMRQTLEKEKELSELKSRFISVASHEFRTPLAIIRGSTDLLERYCRDFIDKKKSKHFQRIHASVDQMLQLLDDVLLIGKAEAGKLQFKPVPLDVVDFCRNLVELLQLNASKHEIVFTHRGECDRACMDENLLRHILTNLLSNAIKYSPEGGTVKFDLTCEDSTVTFRVRDRGIGIPSTDLQRLFEPFHRATNVGIIQGTGLGLAIIKKSVEVHGGQITVDSEVGVGTTFTVTLPKQPAAVVI